VLGVCDFIGSITPVDSCVKERLLKRPWQLKAKSSLRALGPLGRRFFASSRLDLVADRTHFICRTNCLILSCSFRLTVPQTYFNSLGNYRPFDGCFISSSPNSFSFILCKISILFLNISNISRTAIIDLSSWPLADPSSILECATSTACKL